MSLSYKKIKGGETMNAFQAPLAESSEAVVQADLCGVNCDWGFGLGIVIAMVGPLPGPT